MNSRTTAKGHRSTKKVVPRPGKKSRGHRDGAAQTVPAARRSSKSSSGQWTRDLHHGSAARRSRRASENTLPTPDLPGSVLPARKLAAPTSSLPESAGVGQVAQDAHIQGADSGLSSLIPAIRELHRQRQDFHGAEKKLSLQIKAIQRRVHAVGCDKPTHAKCPGVYDGSSPVVDAISASRKTLEVERKIREKEMERQAKALPVWPWWEAIRGVGALGLAQIVAEAGGELTLYANPAKLWKRFGVGLVGDQRQRLVKDAELAIAMGYNPSRRSILHVIGESLMKGNRGEWKALYDARKEYERARPACLDGPNACGIKDPAATRCTDAHTHNRALRYMEKRLLRDLWREWRRVAPAKIDATSLVSLSGLQPSAPAILPATTMPYVPASVSSARASA